MSGYSKTPREFRSQKPLRRQEMPLNAAKKKNPAAVVLGRLGGKVKTPKGFAKMDRSRLAEVARKGGRSVKTLRKNLGNRRNSA
jgi:general stress protein YciG